MRSCLKILWLLSVLILSGCNDNGNKQEGAVNTRQSGEENRPNVIIIYTDDVGYGDLSSYRATAVQTPNIDSLAEEGMRFTNAHSMASTCTPSRFSILTGEYAFRKQGANILPGNASLLVPRDQATLGTVFQGSGYPTRYVGKWHLGRGTDAGPDWNGQVTPVPNEVGFDYSFIFPATADRVPTVYIENHEVVAWDPSDTIAVSYDHKVGNEPTGKEHPELLKMGLTAGHDGTIVNGISRIGWMAGGQKARWTDESLAEDFLSQAQLFIDRNQNEPFFLFYAPNEIHVPRMPNTRFKGASKLGYRGDVIVELDYVVGRLMDTLDQLDLTNNTLVIFTSDNGPVLDDGYEYQSVELAEKNDHQPSGLFRGGKYSLFEGGTRTPFIVHCPEWVQPGEYDALINQTDLVDSFADMNNLMLEEGDAVDRRNILKALLGKTKDGRESNIEQNKGAVLALVKDGWKYIETSGGPAVFRNTDIESGLSEKPHLYNLNKDPEEQDNIASEYPDKAEAMAKELDNIKGAGNK